MKEILNKKPFIVLVVIVVVGLVYYSFFYTPSLGHYVYMERRNNYTIIAHSKENCSSISGGVRRMKTKDFLAELNSIYRWTYCNKCLSCDMLIDYSIKYHAPISQVMKNNSNEFPINQISQSSLDESKYYSLIENNDDEEESGEYDDYTDYSYDEEDEEDEFEIEDMNYDNDSGI